MRHDWILDVLTDAKDYALAHGMVALAAKLDETARIAEAEIAVSAVAGPCDSGAKRSGKDS